MIYAVGIFMLAIGCVFVLLGVVEVYLATVRDRSVTKSFGADDVNAAAALIAAFAKLPPFVLLIVTGITLVGVGQRLVDARELFSY